MIQYCGNWIRAGIMVKTILLLLSLLVSTQAWVDVRDRVKNRVIHIESLDERGRWLQQNDHTDSAGGRYLWINTMAERDIYYEPRYGFEVRLCAGEKYVCMESLSLRNYYLAAGYPPNEPWHVVKLSYSTYNEDNAALHWKLLCEDESMEKCKVVPVRFEGDGFLLVRSGWDAGLAQADDDEMRVLFRIHAPSPSDGMKQVYTDINTGSHEALSKFTTYKGVKQSSSSSHTMTSATSVEIGGAFKAFSASASTSVESSWSTTDITTFESSRKIEHDITVPPRTTINIYQLVGNYADQFNVRDMVYCIEEIPLDGGEKRSQIKIFRGRGSRTRSVQSCSDL